MTHREHVSKEEAQAFVERIVQLEAELAQAVTRAEAAEQEARELRALAGKVGVPQNLGIEMQTVSLFHVKDGDRPLYVVAHDWNEALALWRDIITSENDDCGPDELVVKPLRVVDLDQVVR